ncbi:hypothetical protein CsSME_00010193 [Camellia sinensis var. sinensis]
MGKGPFSFRRTSSRRRMKKPPHTEVEVVSLLPNNAIDAQSPNNAAAAAVNNSISAMVAAGTSIKPKKKAGGAKLWMRFDKFGQSELIECDKSMIIKRASIPARDLRILGPIFSHSSNILGNSFIFKSIFDPFSHTQAFTYTYIPSSVFLINKKANSETHICIHVYIYTCNLISTFCDL